MGHFLKTLSKMQRPSCMKARLAYVSPRPLAPMTSRMTPKPHLVLRREVVVEQSVRDAWLRRRTISVANDVIESCRRGRLDAGVVIASALESLRPIGEAVTGDASVTTLLASAKEVAKDMASGKAVEYWPTGFRDLDGILGGLYPRETTIIAARTSNGKTMFATQVTQHIVENTPKTAALYVTLEMPAKSFTRRLIASRARIDGRHLRRNTLSADEVSKVMTAAVELSKLPIYFAQSQSQTIMSIHAMAEATARQLKLKGERLVLIVVDHVGLVKASDNIRKGAARNEQVAETSRGLRFLSERHGCHVLGLSQIVRGTEQRKGADQMPGLSDLKESSALEDDADNVIILHRPRDEMKQFIDGPAWVSAAKGRNDGTGLFKLGVDKAYLRFVDFNE